MNQLSQAQDDVVKDLSVKCADTVMEEATNRFPDEDLLLAVVTAQAETCSVIQDLGIVHPDVFDFLSWSYQKIAEEMRSAATKAVSLEKPNPNERQR